MKKLEDQLQEIESLKCFSAHKKAAISEASVGWHLEHSLLVMNSVLEGLRASKPENFAPQRKLAKYLVFLTGYIIRKKGKAPKFTVPVEDTHEENIDHYLERIRRHLSHAKELPLHSYISHPYFGDIHREESLKFLYIHNHHHLKMVRDILK